MLTATTPAAAEPKPPEELPTFTITSCGDQTLTVEALNLPGNFRPGEDDAFSVAGNYTARITDGDSSIVLRLPGLLTGEMNDGVGTITQSGRSLLFGDPMFPFIAEEIEKEGLPELSVIVGKFVYENTLIPTAVPDVFIPTSFDIVRIDGRVIDVCELLAR
jgi:hypothetical protein